MAVYTQVSAEEVEEVLADFDIGDLRSLIGIQQGVENSNYFLDTTSGRYVLTLYERRVNPDDLPFFLNLMTYLADRGISCPLPVVGKDGCVLRQVKSRPAAIVTFLEGTSPRRPAVAQCRALGRALADMHNAAAGFEGRRANDLSVDAWRELWAACLASDDRLVRELQSEVGSELDQIVSIWPRQLPRGIIHADLFPDNVFFKETDVSGMIDFYFACVDIRAYDLAICLNAWCFEEGTEFNITKARSLAGAYHERHPLSRAELAALPILLRGACMRFLLTRLYDWVHAVEGALVKPKDPREYLAKLRFHRDVRGPEAYGFD